MDETIAVPAEYMAQVLHLSVLLGVKGKTTALCSSTSFGHLSSLGAFAGGG